MVELGGNIEFSDDITSIIDSVAKGFTKKSAKNQRKNQQEQLATFHTIPQTSKSSLNQHQMMTPPVSVPAAAAPATPMVDLTMVRKYLCVVCKRKFRRVRDLQTHTGIMHKQMSDEDRELMRVEIEKTNQMLANYRRMLKTSRRRRPAQMVTSSSSSASSTSHNMSLFSTSASSAAISAAQLATTSSGMTLQQTQMLANKVCPICNKVFKSDSSSNMTSKTFMRHLQIQHGLSEK